MSITTAKEYERKLGPTGVHYPLLSKELASRLRNKTLLSPEEIKQFKDYIFDVHLEEGAESMPKHKIGYLKLMELSVDFHSPDPNILQLHQRFEEIVRSNKEYPNMQLSSVIARFKSKYFPEQ